MKKNAGVTKNITSCLNRFKSSFPPLVWAGRIKTSDETFREPSMNVRPQLASIRARYGYPYHQWMTQEFDELGWKLVQKSLLQKRFHDVTLLIEGPDKRFALMSKHSYPPGVFRSPSGG